jgi:hypothetical protein
MPSGIVNFDNLLQLEKPFIVKEEVVNVAVKIVEEDGICPFGFLNVHVNKLEAVLNKNVDCLVSK